MSEKAQVPLQVAMQVGGAEEKPSIFRKGGIYFYSSVVTGNKNVFVTPEYMDLLVNAFKMAEIKHDVKNIAYCVMPNHFLWVFKLSDDKDNPVDVYKEVKGQVSLEVIKNLVQEAKDESKHYALHELFQNNEKVGRSNPRKILWMFKEKAKELNTGGRYRVFDKKKLLLLEDEENLARNLRYVFEAPVRSRWALVDKAEDYPYMFVSEDYQDRLAS